MTRMTRMMEAARGGEVRCSFDGPEALCLTRKPGTIAGLARFRCHEPALSAIAFHWPLAISMICPPMYSKFVARS
jgi:hypothetical protein